MNAETYLRHSDALVMPILHGWKTLTARYDFERDISEGDIIDLRDESDSRFAWAHVHDTRTETIENFVQRDPEGHKSYSSVDNMIESMSQYYPDVTLHEDSQLTIIEYEVLAPTRLTRRVV